MGSAMSVERRSRGSTGSTRRGKPGGSAVLQQEADVHDGPAGSGEAKGKPMTITTELLPLTARPAWKALEAHYSDIGKVHLRTLFADDASRGERLTAEGAGIFLDYSKNRVTDET